MNTISPRGVYTLLLLPYMAIGFTDSIQANADHDFLRVHPSQVTVFQRENLPALAQSTANSREYIDMYMVTGKVHTAAMLGRGLYYFPIMSATSAPKNTTLLRSA